MLRPETRRALTRLLIVLGLVAAVGLAASLWKFKTGPDDQVGKLVVYCAHDATFAQAVIDRFEADTGIAVEVRFDEEANKSLGLTNLLLAERDHPRCDVFWNNQTLGTIRLQREGLLAAYKGPGFQRIPAAFKSADGYWTGFAARLRVILVNTATFSAAADPDRAAAETKSPESFAPESDTEVVSSDNRSYPEVPRAGEIATAVANQLSQESLQRVAIAQPLFGTTLTHYSVLAAESGLDWLKQWHASLHARGIREVRGNAAVRDLVAAGLCDFGFTDTDDAFGALDNGRPVVVLPVLLDNGQTIAMPNSVAMIRNCPHPDQAARFIDFLLSEETELELARSAARQIPLGPVDASQLPEEVRVLQQWAAGGVSLEPAAEINSQVLDWLTSEQTGE